MSDEIATFTFHCEYHANKLPEFIIRDSQQKLIMKHFVFLFYYSDDLPSLLTPFDELMNNKLLKKYDLTSVNINFVHTKNKKYNYVRGQTDADQTKTWDSLTLL